MEKFDVDDLRNAESEYTGIPLCNEKWTFYYDETGNCRKLYLKEGGVNTSAAFKEDFILGGVVVDSTNINIESLFNSFKFKNKMPEIKFKHVSKGEKEFLSIIKQENIGVLIDWLLNNEIDIHYSTTNNLYFSLVDIVDSTLEIHYEQEFGFSQENINQLKAALYRFAKENQEEVLEYFFKYEYPNVKKERMQEFAKGLSDMIQCWASSEDFFLEMFRQMLNYAGRQKRLTFLEDESPYQLIENYFSIYFQRCYTYKNSQHIFDREPYIENNFKKFQILENNHIFNNWKFCDSKNNKFIQLSDMVVGLLSKLFQWLDSFNISDLPKIKNIVSDVQYEMIIKIDSLIKRANSRNIMLINNTNSQEIILERDYKLEILAD